MTLAPNPESVYTGARQIRIRRGRFLTSISQIDYTADVAGNPPVSSNRWRIPVTILPGREGQLTKKDAEPESGQANDASMEEGLQTYQLARDGGALTFWDEPEEDVYSFEDGEEI